MEIVIVVRHGVDGLDGLLSAYGRRQMEKLVERIAPLCEGKRIGVFTSELKRAIQSGDVVARRFGGTLQTCKALNMELYDSSRYQVEELLKVVGNSQVVVAITHNAAPSGIANEFSKKHGGQGVAEECSNNGYGFVVSLNDGAVTRLPDNANGK